MNNERFFCNECGKELTAHEIKINDELFGEDAIDYSLCEAHLEEHIFEISH